MIKTVCFGEIMLRLSPPGFERLLQSPVLGATFGGGEANVAVSLAQFGCDSWYVTRVPAHAIGDAAIRTLRGEGVNVEHVLRGGSRLGIYFAETGASQRASTVDLRPRPLRDQRAGAGQRAVARRLRGRGVVPLDRHHPGAQPRGGRLHARGDRGGAARGRRVSVDLNYRKKLWSEAEAQTDDAAADAAGRSGHRQRRGPAVGARHRGAAR